MNYLEITGTLKFKPANPLLPLAKYVFQKVAPGLGNIPGKKRKNQQMRRHVIPRDPKTPAQMARRALMRAALWRWRFATAEELKTWSIDAQNRSISVFNASTSDTLRNFKLVNGVLVAK